jgi:hypothetical protein
MTSPTLSDTKVLRYRSAAVSLSRSAEQCRVVLQEMQQERTDAIPAPHPIPAAAPQPRAQAQPQAPKPQAPALHSAAGQMTAGQIEKAKNDARALLAGIAKAGTAHGPGQGLTGPRLAPDADAQMALAVTAALAAHRDSTALQNPTRA